MQNSRFQNKTAVSFCTNNNKHLLMP